MLGRFLSELRRRNVISVMAAYAIGAFAIVSAADLIVPTLALPAWITTMLLVAAIVLAPCCRLPQLVLRAVAEGLRSRHRPDEREVAAAQHIQLDEPRHHRHRRRRLRLPDL